MSYASGTVETLSFCAESGTWRVTALKRVLQLRCRRKSAGHFCWGGVLFCDLAHLLAPGQAGFKVRTKPSHTVSALDIAAFFVMHFIHHWPLGVVAKPSYKRSVFDSLLKVLSWASKNCFSITLSSWKRF